MSWKETEFENLYEIPSKNGLTRPARVRGSGFKMINMGELFANDRIGAIDMELVPMNDKELSQMLVEKDDLLFARQSLVLSGAGKCSIVKDVDQPTTFESHIIRVRLNRKVSNPKFYYYYFKSPSCRIKSIVTQGVQAGIRGNDLKQLSVHTPPIEVQDKVTELLENYDDLIENNKRRIELLEESARQLYKEWFVRFRFPGHEHVKIIDGVPEAWECKKVGELLMKVKRPGKVKKDDYLEFGDFPCVDQSQDFIGGYTDEPEVVIKEPLPLVVFGDHTRVLKFISFPFACGADGTQLLHPIDNRLSIEYFYFALVAIDLSNYFYARHFKFLKDQLILIPSEHLMQAFTDFSSSNMKQISKLRDQNKQLALARDILLPKLMNGEIAV